MGRVPSLVLEAVALRDVEFSMIVDKPTMMGAVELEGRLVVRAVPFSATLLLGVGVTALSGTPVPDMVSDPVRGRSGLNRGREVEDWDLDNLVGCTTSCEIPPFEPTWPELELELEVSAAGVGDTISEGKRPVEPRTGLKSGEVLEDFSGEEPAVGVTTVEGM